MRVGVPKEIKVHEYRVGMTPPSVAELTAAGHEVFVEAGAGAGIDFSDDDYRAVGAKVLDSAEAVFDAADMIVKVKEPQLHGCDWLRPKQELFTYPKLEADKPHAEEIGNAHV